VSISGIVFVNGHILFLALKKVSPSAADKKKDQSGIQNNFSPPNSYPFSRIMLGLEKGLYVFRVI